jgi:hypothetical protein
VVIEPEVLHIVWRFFALRAAIPSLLAESAKEVRALIVVTVFMAFGARYDRNVIGGPS